MHLRILIPSKYWMPTSDSLEREFNVYHREGSLEDTEGTSNDSEIWGLGFVKSFEFNGKAKIIPNSSPWGMVAWPRRKKSEEIWSTHLFSQREREREREREEEKGKWEAIEVEEKRERNQIQMRKLSPTGIDVIFCFVQVNQGVVGGGSFFRRNSIKADMAKLEPPHLYLLFPPLGSYQKEETQDKDERNSSSTWLA